MTEYQKFYWKSLFVLFFIGMICVIPVFGQEFGIPAAIIYFIYRIRRLKFLKDKENNTGVWKDMHDSLDKLEGSVVDFMSVSVTPQRSDYMECLTCNCLRSKEAYKMGQRKCYSTSIYEHNVDDVPPENNPYKYWWHQIHGYDPFYPDQNDIDQMKAHGVKYWSEHTNFAWDSGYTMPPDWYVRMKVIELAKI